jgi:SNF2 family DNA or RNA helicase
MDIIDNKALLLRTRAPEKIISAIPKSEIVSHRDGLFEVLVNWELDEARVLRNLRIKDVPSPIKRDYKWSGLYKPFNHQEKTAEFLTLHKKAFVFNEAGTGKTAATIWAADYLMKKKAVSRALIICPLSIMESAWLNDLFKIAMHRTATIAYGAAAKRKEIICGDAEFVIINYDGVDIVRDEILASGFDLIICDEASALKNVSTRRWKTINSIVKPDTWLWLMTGTPAAQSPMDAYGMAKLVSPERVPKTAGAWKDMVMSRITQFKWVPKPRAKETVFKALQPAIRYTKAECLDLPDVTYITRDVELTAQQRRYYQELKNEMLFTASGEEVTALNAASSINKLLQISGGAVYTDGQNTLEFDISPRLKVLKEVLDETENKTLIFIPYRHAITLVSEYLQKLGVSAEVINGDVNPSKRAEIFQKFQTQSDPKVLIIQPQAASHGVTLTAADNVVFWSPVMSLETYLQCIARIDRVGQKNKMTVTHLQGSDVERKLYKALQERKNLHVEMVGMYKKGLGD